jgi:hypothetical protein
MKVPVVYKLTDCQLTINGQEFRSFDLASDLDFTASITLKEKPVKPQYGEFEFERKADEMPEDFRSRISDELCEIGMDSVMRHNVLKTVTSDKFSVVHLPTEYYEEGMTSVSEALAWLKVNLAIETAGEDPERLRAAVDNYIGQGG